MRCLADDALCLPRDTHVEIALAAAEYDAPDGAAGTVVPILAGSRLSVKRLNTSATETLPFVLTLRNETRSVILLLQVA